MRGFHLKMIHYEHNESKKKYFCEHSNYQFYKPDGAIMLHQFVGVCKSTHHFWNFRLIKSFDR